MTPIAVVGASGLTGGLVAWQLTAAGHAVRLLGRREAPLRHLAEALGGVVEVRAVDALDGPALHRALAGCRAVVSAAGPFRRLGPPVARACIDLRLPYVDTSAEQPWILHALTHLDGPARRAGVAVVPAAAVEFAPSGAAAWIAEGRVGPLTEVDVTYALDGFLPSAGTLGSAVAVVDAPWTGFVDGWRRAPPLLRAPRPSAVAGQARAPFPGSDEVILPAELRTLRTVNTWLSLPGGQAWTFAALGAAGRLLGPRVGRRALAALEARVHAGSTDPDPAARAAARFEVVLHATGARGTCTVRVEGRDVYATSAALAASTVQRLADGEGRAAGVHTVGGVLDPVAFLDGLAEAGVGWRVEDLGP